MEPSELSTKVPDGRESTLRGDVCYQRVSFAEQVTSLGHAALKDPLT